VLEVEIFGDGGPFSALPPSDELRRLSALAAAAGGVRDGHVAIEFVSPQRSAELNARHRRRRTATDVLSFPVDGTERTGAAPRELGDVVICPEHTRDVREAVVHGVLHLVGFDHERDDGEMLDLQARLLAS
jgi:probable rRNA maturation factor